MNKPGLFIKYESQIGGTYRQQVVSFQYEGQSRSVRAGGISGEIKCLKCGSNNWSDNGRSINEYECITCGWFVTIEPIN